MVDTSAVSTKEMKSEVFPRVVSALLFWWTELVLLYLKACIVDYSPPEEKYLLFG